MSGLTHIDADGNAVMVDVGDKATTRVASAACSVIMQAETIAAISDGNIKKGDVLFHSTTGWDHGFEKDRRSHSPYVIHYHSSPRKSNFR